MKRFKPAAILLLFVGNALVRRILATRDWEVFGMEAPTSGEIRQRLIRFVRFALAREPAQ